jgi:hypothetical protein
VKPILITVAVLCVTPAMAHQQPASTVEVCRAEAAVWFNGRMAADYTDAQDDWVGNKIPNRTETARLPVKELMARQSEMFDCAKVDRENRGEYYEAGEFYHNVLTDRETQFIDRHGLWQQFVAEDAAGQR